MEEKDKGEYNYSYKPKAIQLVFMGYFFTYSLQLTSNESIGEKKVP